MRWKWIPTKKEREERNRKLWEKILGTSKDIKKDLCAFCHEPSPSSLCPKCIYYYKGRCRNLEEVRKFGT